MNEIYLHSCYPSAYTKYCVPRLLFYLNTKIQKENKTANTILLTNNNNARVQCCYPRLMPVCIYIYQKYYTYNIHYIHRALHPVCDIRRGRNTSQTINVYCDGDVSAVCSLFRFTLCSSARYNAYQSTIVYLYLSTRDCSKDIFFSNCTNYNSD